MRTSFLKKTMIPAMEEAARSLLLQNGRRTTTLITSTAATL
jgi:hypothetical protein